MEGAGKRPGGEAASGKPSGWADWFERLTPGEKMSHRFRRCNQLHKKLVDKNMVKAEIYAAQHRILGLLNHKPMMSQKEIAQVMEVSTATIAVTLKKMEKSGYVEKIMDAEDNRFNKIRVTDKGKEMLGLGFDIMGRIDRESVKCLSEEEVVLLNGLLQRYYGRLSEMLEEDYTEAGPAGEGQEDRADTGPCRQDGIKQKGERTE